MVAFSWTTARENFLLRLDDDGGFTTHSDTVARVSVAGKDYRLVSPAGAARLKKARAGRSRADALAASINALPVRQRLRDDVYLAACRLDGHKKMSRLRLWLRMRGYARKLWKY